MSDGGSILSWVLENIQNCFSRGICLISKLSLNKHSRVNKIVSIFCDNIPHMFLPLSLSFFWFGEEKEINISFRRLP